MLFKSIAHCSLSQIDQYLSIIKQLSPSPNICSCFPSPPFFMDLFNKYVGLIDDNVAVIGTVVFEDKLSYGGCLVAHIEDVVVLSKLQGLGYGAKMVEFLVDIAKTKECRKIVLSCSEYNKPFYEKCGFHQSNIEMRMDLE